MGIHEDYGKRLFGCILGERWVTSGDARSVRMASVRADLDGVILSEELSEIECAVEIEARIYKQIRGAILDLFWHPAPRKMLTVILAQSQLGNEEKARAHLMFVCRKLASGDNRPFELVILRGSGEYPAEEDDRVLLSGALKRLQLIL
jgi:hypothetical protein